MTTPSRLGHGRPSKYLQHSALCRARSAHFLLLRQDGALLAGPANERPLLCLFGQSKQTHCWPEHLVRRRRRRRPAWTGAIDQLLVISSIETRGRIVKKKRAASTMTQARRALKHPPGRPGRLPVFLAAPGLLGRERLWGRPLGMWAPGEWRRRRRRRTRTPQSGRCGRIRPFEAPASRSPGQPVEAGPSLIRATNYHAAGPAVEALVLFRASASIHFHLAPAAGAESFRFEARALCGAPQTAAGDPGRADCFSIVSNCRPPRRRLA